MFIRSEIYIKEIKYTPNFVFRAYLKLIKYYLIQANTIFISNYVSFIRYEKSNKNIIYKYISL